MTTVRSKLIALLGLVLLGVIFYSFHNDFANKQVFPKADAKVTKTLTSTIQDNAAAQAQLQAALNGSLTDIKNNAKPAPQPKNSIDSTFGSVFSASMSKVSVKPLFAKSDYAGKILYITSLKPKINGFMFVPLKLGQPQPSFVEYSLKSGVSFVEGSYAKNGGANWCVVLKRGGVYQKSSNSDPSGYISFGKLSCVKGK